MTHKKNRMLKHPVFVFIASPQTGKRIACFQFAAPIHRLVRLDVIRAIVAWLGNRR
jgi:hypothetical protein